MQAADSFIRGQLASNSDSSACDVASQSDAESGETAHYAWVCMHISYVGASCV